MEKCFVLFRNNQIYIKSSNSSNILEYTFQNSVVYPNVPLYFDLFTNEKIIKDLKKFIKDNIYKNNSLLQSIFAKKVFLLIPDDVTNITEIEKRAFEELAKIIFGVNGVILGSECGFVAPLEQNEYICISRTCRMMVLSYFKNKNIFKQKFIANKDYTNEELLSIISELYEGIGVSIIL